MIVPVFVSFKQGDEKMSVETGRRTSRMMLILEILMPV